MLLLVSSLVTRILTPSGYFTTRKVSVLASSVPGSPTQHLILSTQGHYYNLNNSEEKQIMEDSRTFFYI